MEGVRLVEEIDAAHPGQGVGCEENNHPRIGRPSQDFQPFQRSGRRRFSDHVIVGGVPSDQLPLSIVASSSGCS